MDKEFFDLEMYAIYGAITELFGQKGWDVVWRSGEIAFDYIKKQLDIKEKEPFAVMKKVAQYLETIGYAKRLNVKKTGENQFIYEMYGPLGRESVSRLKKKYKDPVLPHYSTTFIFAALKDICNMKAEITHLQRAKPGEDPSTEKWVLSKIE